jgi:histidine triad (HIT) family protein
MHHTLGPGFSSRSTPKLQAVWHSLVDLEVKKYAGQMTMPTTSPPDCLFCQVVAGEVPAVILHADDTTVAFRDIAPQAPLHLLVIPRRHFDNVAEVATGEPGTVADLIATADRVATAEGLDTYRLVFNTGADAHQTVFHAHLHVLGGRLMTWPPG